MCCFALFCPAALSPYRAAIETTKYCLHHGVSIRLLTTRNTPIHILFLTLQLFVGSYKSTFSEESAVLGGRPAPLRLKLGTPFQK